MSKQSEVRVGGLFRCCINTVDVLSPDEDYEGNVKECLYCKEPSLVFTNGAWEWNKEGKYE